METAEIIGIAATATAAVVIGIIIANAIKNSKNSEIIDEEKLLEDCFGEHMYVSMFTLLQAKDWIKVRKENIEKGSKALIMKITTKTLKELNINAEINMDIDNYLTIAMVNNGQMEDSILIKYEELDSKLEEMLAKGDGTLVVGGWFDMFLSLLASLAVGYAVGYGVGYGVGLIIAGIINKHTLKEKMQAEGIKKIVLKTIDTTKNQVKFTDLDTDEEYTCDGDEIGDDIYEGQKITIWINKSHTKFISGLMPEERI